MAWFAKLARLLVGVTAGWIIVSTVSGDVFAQEVALDAPTSSAPQQSSGVPRIPVGCRVVVSAPENTISVTVEGSGADFYGSTSDSAEDYLDFTFQMMIDAQTSPQAMTCKATVTFSGFQQIFVSESNATIPAVLPTDLVRDYTHFMYNGPGDYLLTINWQVNYSLDGASGPWSFPSELVQESFDFFTNGCVIQIATDTTQTNYYGRFQDSYGN